MTTYSKSEYEKYLNILEVNATDSLDTIKSAYRKLVAKYHPDKQTDDVAKELANEKLKMVNQAYEYLCKYYDTYSSGQSTDYENYSQEETTYNSNYSYEDYSKEYQEDNYEYNDNANDNNFENYYDNEYTYYEPYEQENNYNQQNLYTQNADGCSITITVIVLFIVACIIVAIITSSDNSHDKNISNDQRLNQYSYNNDNNIDNTIQEQERKNAENAQKRLGKTISKEQALQEHKVWNEIMNQQNTNKLDTTTNFNNISTTQKNERENWVDDYDVDFSKNPKSFTSLNNKVRLTPMPEKTTTRRTKINVEKEVKENDAYLFE